MADLTKDIIYRLFTLNDEDIQTNLVGGNAIGAGISGCVIDTFDLNDVDIVQFMEKRSLQDGMDVGQVFKGARRIRLTGTLYGTSRADLYDRLQDLRAALDPVLAQADEPADFGYQPLYFSTPTLDLANFPSGYISKRVLALPRAIAYLINRDTVGGEEEDALALQWQATMVCRDPRIMGEEAQEYTLTNTTVCTNATVSASTNRVTYNNHGLVVGDRVRFYSLTGGTGLSTSTTYYVLAVPDANTFTLATSSGGAEVDITVNYSDADFVVSATSTGSLVNRGDHYGVLNMLLVTDGKAGSVSAQIGTSVFTITIPSSSATERIIRLKGDDKVITIEEDGGTEVTDMDMISFTGDNTWPQVQPGTNAYSVAVHGTHLTDSLVWFWETYA